MKREKKRKIVTGKKKLRKYSLMIFGSLWARLFWRDGKKTFDMGTSRLPATDLGNVLCSTISCVVLCSNSMY